MPAAKDSYIPAAKLCLFCVIVQWRLKRRLLVLQYENVILKYLNSFDLVNFIIEY